MTFYLLDHICFDNKNFEVSIQVFLLYEGRNHHIVTILGPELPHFIQVDCSHSLVNLETLLSKFVCLCIIPLNISSVLFPIAYLWQEPQYEGYIPFSLQTQAIFSRASCRTHVLSILLYTDLMMMGSSSFCPWHLFNVQLYKMSLTQCSCTPCLVQRGGGGGVTSGEWRVWKNIMFGLMEECGRVIYLFWFDRKEWGRVRRGVMCISPICPFI